MIRNLNRFLAAAVVLAAVVPAYAGGGGSKGGKGGGHHSSGHAGHHDGNHNHYGYRYYGVWPYGYYAYDDGPVVVPLVEEDPGLVSSDEREEPRATMAPPAAALVRIHTVPGAKLWFDGSPTSQSGVLRTFSTPPLDLGRSYSYGVRACWLEDGRPVVRSLTVKVMPGETADLDMR
jgi:uncharacterized protein (TIGR03000 family)